MPELADDAQAVIEASGAKSVVPVGSAHSVVAIELRRRLGSRIQGIVALEWLILGLPPQLSGALEGIAVSGALAPGSGRSETTWESPWQYRGGENARDWDFARR